MNLIIPILICLASDSVWSLKTEVLSILGYVYFPEWWLSLSRKLKRNFFLSSWWLKCHIFQRMLSLPLQSLVVWFGGERLLIYKWTWLVIGSNIILRLYTWIHDTVLFFCFEGPPLELRAGLRILFAVLNAVLVVMDYLFYRNQV